MKDLIINKLKEALLEIAKTTNDKITREFAYKLCYYDKRF